MTGIMVPPAQAEALFDAHNDYDAQDDLRPDYLAELRRCDRTAGQPWRDDDGDDLPTLSDSAHSAPAAPSAQLWPSSVKSSR